MTDTWRPLGVDDDDEDYSVLFEELTDWLRPSVTRWLSGALTGSRSIDPMVNPHALRALERLLRTSFSVSDFARSSDAAVNLLRDYNGDEWKLLDAALACGLGVPDNLNRYLLESGSAWMVGERQGKPGLVKRVNEGTQAAVQNTIATRGHAGQTLAASYLAAYGVNPDPSRAYGLAVRAVEDAAIPVVSPKNKGATLGTVIVDIRQSAKWKLPHTRTHPTADPHDVLLGMLQMLWTGQHDRHGGVTPPPPSVSQDEAETAVMLAATLVEWFASGKVQKIP